MDESESTFRNEDIDILKRAMTIACEQWESAATSERVRRMLAEIILQAVRAGLRDPEALADKALDSLKDSVASWDRLTVSALARSSRPGPTRRRGDRTLGRNVEAGPSAQNDPTSSKSTDAKPHSAGALAGTGTSLASSARGPILA